MPTTTQNTLMEKQVEDSLKRFDAAVRASTTRLVCKDDEEEQDKRNDLDQEEESLEALASRITAYDSGRKAAQVKPSCRPWDYKDFTSRLKTFTPLNWFAKPSSVSPPMCARFGWVNRARDILACECCGAQLRYSAEAEGSSQGQGNEQTEHHGNGATSQVQEEGHNLSITLRLSSQHHHLCPWKGNACPKEFLQLPPLAGEDWRAEFLSRLKSVLPLIDAHALPEPLVPTTFERHCPGRLKTLGNKARSLGDEGSTEALAVDQASDEATITDAKRKRERMFELKSIQDEVLGAAAAIAVFGWHLAPAAQRGMSFASSPVKARDSTGDGNKEGDRIAGDGPATLPATGGKVRLWCNVCNRRVLTDNFLSVDTGASGSAAACALAGSGTSIGSEGGSRGTKRRRVSCGGTPLKAMDLVAEHRSFCPWANVHPAMEGEGEACVDDIVPGWRQALEALMSWEEPSVNAVPGESKKESDILDEGAAGDKAKEALDKVQRVLNVLIRY